MGSLLIFVACLLCLVVGNQGEIADLQVKVRAGEVADSLMLVVIKISQYQMNLIAEHVGITRSDPVDSSIFKDAL